MLDSRTFDVPHVTIRGKISEQKGETIQVFTRNAVIVKVTINRTNIAGTAFEQEWSQYLPDSQYLAQSNISSISERWHKFCDLVIGSILATLNEIAPADGRRWSTLQDYLDTPTYEIRLVKGQGPKGVATEIVRGPALIESIYEMQPRPLSTFQVPPAMPMVAASDVLVLDHEDHNTAPDKMLISGTREIASLMRSERIGIDRETGIATDHSRLSMESLLKLWPTTGHDLHVVKPIACVTTSRSPGDELLVAGLLHTHISASAQTLQDINAEETMRSHGLAAVWKVQMSAALKALHSRQIYYGDLLPRSIWIDGENAWLEAPRVRRGDEPKEGTASPSEDADLVKLKEIFDS